MRPLNFTQGNNYQYGPSDTIGAAVISSAFAVVAMDYPADARYVRFGSTSVFYTNMRTTGVTVPTSTLTPSTANGTVLHPVQDQNMFSIDAGSTGLSITSPTSGVITLEFWGQ